MEELYKKFLETSGVCTDTRTINKGCMFFALRGETFNGNDFALKALEQGASFAVVDNPDVCTDDRIILVDNVLETLQQLARYNRLKYRIPVIALTGTNGKTTTKELISAVLREKYEVVSTGGNFNNHIGVPLTLLRITDKTQIAVIEMGASAPGEIDMLVKIVCPTFGLITNVGKAHLLGFGSFEGVMKTKGELYDNLRDNKKIAFVNIDNPYLSKMAASRSELQIVPYGIKNDMAKILPNTPGDPYLKMSVPNPTFGSKGDTFYDSKKRDIAINTKLIGDYNADNILAAICVGVHFGIPLHLCIEAISNYTPSNNRSQMLIKGNNTLIVDAYNANPSSMKASLENFAKSDFKSKILILGDMLELGSDSILEHSKILNYALEIKPKPESIYLVGGEFAKAYDNLNIKAKNIKLFKTVAELDNELRLDKPANSTILIKGSHGIHLEKLIETI